MIHRVEEMRAEDGVDEFIVIHLQVRMSKHWRDGRLLVNAMRRLLLVLTENPSEYERLHLQFDQTLQHAEDVVDDFYKPEIVELRAKILALATINSMPS